MSIMRKQSFVQSQEPSPLKGGPSDGNVDKFYEELLDKDDYDSDLIKKLFLDKRVRFTQENRMKRYFNNEFNTNKTTTMQDELDSKGSLNESSILSGTDDLLNGMRSFTESEENEWDNTIIPLKKQFNRR